MSFQHDVQAPEGLGLRRRVASRLVMQTCAEWLSGSTLPSVALVPRTRSSHLTCRGPVAKFGFKAALES